MKTQMAEQFSHLESYGNKRKEPIQLELFPKQIKTQIANILGVKHENTRYYNNEIEPLDSSEM